MFFNSKKKSNHRKQQNSRTQRKLNFETLQSRELFYASPITPISPHAVPEDTRHAAEQAEKVARPGESIDTGSGGFSFFPQGSPFKSTRYSPHPIGLFPDGSDRTVTSDISPRVAKLMIENNTGPITSTLHRPRIGYGSPTKTLGGMDPKIRELTTMKENWASAHGEVTRCIQRIEIAPENMASNVDIDTLYSWLEDFRVFAPGNVATVKVYRPGPLDFQLPEGESYAIFTVNTLDHFGGTDPYWNTLNTIQLAVNDRNIPVKLYSDPETHQLAAVTLENHMLVGVRVWRIYELQDGWVRIETESHEQRNGAINNVAAQVAARTTMEEVWRRYLRNLGYAATGGTGRFAEMTAQWFDLPTGMENPWKDLKSIQLPQVKPTAFGFPILQRTR